VNLTSMDIYRPARACRKRGAAPVVMWVHGGGYQIGDKSQQVRDKVRLFTGLGWIFASVNYRLTRAGDPQSAHWPDQFEDVSAAAAWVRRHIAAWGGDGRRIALLGHSAGADIVSNVVTNPLYLRRWHLTPRAVRCDGPLDTDGFDKPAAPLSSRAQWTEALGNAPDYLTTTSATLRARRGVGTPPTITVVRGTRTRQTIEQGFANRLSALGVPVTVIDARSLTHNQVNTQIGAPADNVMTPPLVRFLMHCLQ
jgi:arylformamidase